MHAHAINVALQLAAMNPYFSDTRKWLQLKLSRKMNLHERDASKAEIKKDITPPSFPCDYLLK